MPKEKIEEKKTDAIVIPEEEKKEAPPEGYTEEEWRDLSDAEKEGIKDKGEKIEEKEELTEEQLKAIAETEKKDEKEDKKVVTEVIEEKVKAKEVEEKEVEVKERLSDEELLSFRPRIDRSQIPQPEEEVIPDEIQTKLDELQQKYDDGEIALAKFIMERDALNRKIVMHNNTLYEATKEASISELTWKAEQIAFFKARPEYEYTKEGSPKGKALYGALNQVTRDLDSDPENAGLSGVAMLIKADKIVKKAFGMDTQVKKEDKKKEVKSTEKDKKPDAKIPDEKTLTDLPEAERNTAEGPWGELDKLTGAAYERALEKLTPDQRNRYLAAR